MHLQLGGSQCLLVKTSIGYCIYGLCTLIKQRNQGHAKKLLRAIRKFSDRTGCQIELTASPFPTYNDPKFTYKEFNLYYKTNRDRAVKLYKRMGFKKKRRSFEMVYIPKRAKNENS